MNQERLRTLAELIGNGTYALDMSGYCSNTLRVGEPPACGTTFCIAGLAVFLWGREREFVDSKYIYLGMETRFRAAEILGLNLEQAGRLFFNKGQFISETVWLDEITPDEAVAAIDRMIDESRIVLTRFSSSIQIAQAQECFCG